MKKSITPEDVKKFIQDDLTFINRAAFEIEWVDKNGCTMTEGFSNDVFTAINKAILAEKQGKHCEWIQDRENNYVTSCGYIYCIIEGTASENNMNFCCFCGEQIIQELYKDAIYE